MKLTIGNGFMALMSFTLMLRADDLKRSYDLPEHGSITLKVPSAWKGEVGQPPGVLPPTIRFSPPSGPQFRVMITPIWQAKADKPLPEGVGVRELVEQSADQVQSQASNKIEIKELKGVSGAGYYFMAIDPAPKPGEWKYMTQGVLRVGDLMVTFTILTNDGQDAVVKAALEMLKGATRIASNVIANAKDGYSLDFPIGWKIDKNNKEFAVEHPDGSSFLGITTEGMDATMTLEMMSMMLQFTVQATGSCGDNGVDKFELSDNGWSGSGFHCYNPPTNKVPKSQTIAITIKKGALVYQFVLTVNNQDWKSDRERYLSWFRSLRFYS